MAVRDPNAIRRDAHGRFATTQGIIDELVHTGQADLSTLAAGKNFVKHVTLEDK